MKSPRILLIGIGGVYNYGCEAIVRGTEAIVRRPLFNKEYLPEITFFIWYQMDSHGGFFGAVKKY
jgi:hypothetical protein